MTKIKNFLLIILVCFSFCFDNTNALANDLADTPLITASKKGDLAEVKKLIANGANVNAKSTQGFTPLSAARDKGHTQIVNLL